jgi:hypothetical protein
VQQLAPETVSSASHQRSSVLWISARASAKASKPASIWPHGARVCASIVRKYGRQKSWPLARAAARLLRICAMAAWLFPRWPWFAVSVRAVFRAGRALERLGRLE